LDPVIVNVTVSAVNPLFVIVRIILPIPDEGNPDKLPEDGDAVQLKFELGIVEESRILVV
jgi:hypothetical protein